MQTGEQDMDMEMEVPAANEPSVQQELPSWMHPGVSNATEGRCRFASIVSCKVAHSPCSVINTTLARVWEQQQQPQPQVQPQPQPERHREIIVKVHIRRPEKDSWAYLGRGIVTQENVGQSTRIGVCFVCFHSPRDT